MRRVIVQKRPKQAVGVSVQRKRSGTEAVKFLNQQGMPLPEAKRVVGSHENVFVRSEHNSGIKGRFAKHAVFSLDGKELGGWAPNLNPRKTIKK